MISEPNKYIENTKKWIEQVVIGLNFCPFAAYPFLNDRILYECILHHDSPSLEKAFTKLINQLENQDSWETGFIIIPSLSDSFEYYLIILEHFQDLLVNMKLEGIYQIASFHPKYTFQGSTEDDPSNFTNRSPYPLIHILREDSVTKAVTNHPNTELITQKNIAKTKNLGLNTMQQMLMKCLS